MCDNSSYEIDEKMFKFYFLKNLDEKGGPVWPKNQKLLS